MRFHEKRDWVLCGAAGSKNGLIESEGSSVGGSCEFSGGYGGCRRWEISKGSTSNRQRWGLSERRADCWLRGWSSVTRTDGDLKRPLPSHLGEPSLLCRRQGLLSHLYSVRSAGLQKPLVAGISWVPKSSPPHLPPPVGATPGLRAGVCRPVPQRGRSPGCLFLPSWGCLFLPQPSSLFKLLHDIPRKCPHTDSKSPPQAAQPALSI